MPKQPDGERIATVEADMANLKSDLMELKTEVNSQKGSAWKLLTGLASIVSLLLLLVWGIETKNLKTRIDEALKEDAVQKAREQATNAAAAASQAGSQAVSDAAKVKRILFEIERHQVKQGKVVFQWDKDKAEYKNSKSFSDPQAFFADLRVANAVPMFHSQPMVLLSVYDVEQARPPKENLTRWNIAPLDVSTNGFTIRLSQWGPDRLLTLGVEWTAIEGLSASK